MTDREPFKLIDLCRKPQHGEWAMGSLPIILNDFEI